MQGSVWTAVLCCAERSGAGYFSETPQWHCGSFQHHTCKRYGSCIPPGSALLTVFSFLIRLRAFVHAASSSSCPPPTPSPWEPMRIYSFICQLALVGARSLALYGIRGGKGEGKRRGREKQSANERETRFWFRRRPGKSLCLFQL